MSCFLTHIFCQRLHNNSLSESWKIFFITVSFLRNVSYIQLVRNNLVRNGSKRNAEELKSILLIKFKTPSYSPGTPTCSDARVVLSGNHFTYFKGAAKATPEILSRPTENFIHKSEGNGTLGNYEKIMPNTKPEQARFVIRGEGPTIVCITYYNKCFFSAHSSGHDK